MGKTMDDHLVIRITNNVSEIATVSQLFNDFITQHHIPKMISNAVDLALDEILNNIITYGYVDQNKHEIDIHISISDNHLQLLIEDDGREFNPLATSVADTGSTMEERKIGGLGIHLCRKTMDDIHYKYKNEKNCLTMKKNLRE
jgi:anti-sigma regulatory factor (Ser/Thr protein kinase)